MKFKLITQLPNPKELGIVSINVTRTGEATCFAGNDIVASMKCVDHEEKV